MNYFAPGTAAESPEALHDIPGSAQRYSPPLSVRFRAPSLWGHSSHLLKLSRNNKFNLTPRGVGPEKR